MDQHLLIKIIHMSIASLVFILLIVRAFPVLILKKWTVERTVSNKIIVGLQHFSYSVLILSGLWLLWDNQFQVEMWFYAKVILFLVILSASFKAFSRKSERLLVQRQAGLVIAIVAFLALFALIGIKPQLG